MLNSKTELKVHKYLDKVSNGLSTMSDDTIEMVVSHIRDALKKQFASIRKNSDFRLRMSNIGRPYCQLWFMKNKPETRVKPPAKFIMNMMLGDIVEAVFKGVLKEASVDYDDSDSVKLKLDKATIEGTYDLAIDGSVDDIKSASNWSYTNKFQSFETVQESDPFGYVGQLAGYAKASGKKVGGWWVINKNNADFKYIPAEGLDIEKEVTKLNNTAKRLEENKFERCFEAVEESFRGKPTGNKVLNKNCTFCDFRYECWSSLEEKPAVMSQAREPKITAYVELKKGA